MRLEKEKLDEIIEFVVSWHPGDAAWQVFAPYLVRAEHETRNDTQPRHGYDDEPKRKKDQHADYAVLNKLVRIASEWPGTPRNVSDHNVRSSLWDAFNDVSREESAGWIRDGMGAMVVDGTGEAL